METKSDKSGVAGREAPAARAFVLFDPRSSVVLARVSTRAEVAARCETLRRRSGRTPVVCALD